MKVIKANEGIYYEAKKHSNMWGMRKIGPQEGTSGFLISISEFLPNGDAEMSAAEIERVYTVLRGSITVEGSDGTKHCLNPEDMIYIGPGEERKVTVNGMEAARVMVMVV